MTAISDGPIGPSRARPMHPSAMFEPWRRHLSGLALAGALLAMPGAADAQEPQLAAGDGVVTRFSGFADRSSRRLAGDGVVAEVLEFGTAADIPTEPPVLATLTADEVGQVFAVEIGGSDSPAVYLGASSAYGLYRTEDGRAWAPGMWGPEGGPGTVWKLAPGADPEPFAEIGTQDRPNAGAGLGDLAYDPYNDQLFVSDLSSGLIHAVDPETGETTQTFDHGLDGRSYFLDAASAEYLVIDVAPRDERAGPAFADCRSEAGQSASFASEPACWGLADFRRRVWGLGVNRDPVADTVRLYYAVWGGAALGAENWDVAGEDARTSIWSVRLDGNGGFDLTDVRREAVLPSFAGGGEDTQSETSPVVDIAFTEDGAMVLAERGRPAPDLDAEPARLVEPQSARVLVLVRGEDGTWNVDGRYDAGASERGTVGAPYIRANAAGGVAVDGIGSVRSGGGVASRIWMTADPLCGPDAPCEGIDGGEGRSAGLQITPFDAVSELLPPKAASGPYPSSGSVEAPETLDASDLVILARDLPVGGLGQITVYRGTARDVEIVQAPEAVPENLPAETQPVSRPLPDLAVAKSGVQGCRPGGECVYEVSVTNKGPVDYQGPILITDSIGSPGVSLVSGGSDSWSCRSADGNIFCHLPETTLAPRAQTRFRVSLRPSADHRSPRLNNCAAITWLGRQGRDRIRAVQAQLRVEGFEPGLVDGIMGPNTGSAISAAQRRFGLPENGTITDELIEALFGYGAVVGGDASDANDQDCALVLVDLPPRPQHARQISAFHRKFESQFHDPASSSPIEFHDPGLSNFHVTYRSGLHDGATSAPLILHRTSVSRFHLDHRSEFHDGIYSRFVPTHSPAISAFHESRGSIYHDWRTSRAGDRHRPSLSDFHRRWSSSRHDGRITRLEQSHWVQLSAFHRRFSSRQHDEVTTRVRPSHNPSISHFHRERSSEAHDRRTSRPQPVHERDVSRFHDRAPSALHDRRTSEAEDRHYDNVSAFHRTFASAEHDRRTSRRRPEHREDLSLFERDRPRHGRAESRRDGDGRGRGGVDRHDPRDSAEATRREEEAERRRREILEERRREIQRQREVEERRRQEQLDQRGQDQQRERDRRRELERRQQEQLQRQREEEQRQEQQRQQRQEQQQQRREQLERQRQHQQLEERQDEQQRAKQQQIERQRQLQLQRQEQERARQQELEKQRREQLERQRQLQQQRQQQERAREEQLERQKQQQLEQQRQRQQELQRQRQLEQQRQQQLELQKQQQLQQERQRQQQLQRQRQQQLERQRQQQIEQQRQQQLQQRQQQQLLQQRREQQLQQQQRQQQQQQRRQPPQQNPQPRRQQPQGERGDMMHIPETSGMIKKGGQ